MAIKLLDEIACKVALTEKPQSATLSYGSDLLREIKELDKSPMVNAIASTRSIIYMYNAKIPIMIQYSSVGLAGCFVTITKARPEDVSKLTVYYKEE